MTTRWSARERTHLRALHGLDFYPDTTQRRTVPRRNFQERNQGRIGRWLPTTLCIDRAAATSAATS